MKYPHRLPLLFVALSSLISTGCASLKNYSVDRGHDLADIVTLAAEKDSLGVTLQVGPLITGVAKSDGQGIGLRSGHIGTYDFQDYAYFFGGRKSFDGNDERDSTSYDIESSILGLPFEVLGAGVIANPFCLPDPDPIDWSLIDPPIICDDGGWQVFCQCEVSIGMYGGIRVGLNPAEVLDFILGWTTLDICGDDTASRSRDTVRIAIGDTLELIRMDFIPQPSQEQFSVDAEGNIIHPLAGSVHVAGLTYQDAETLIEQTCLKKGHARDFDLRVVKSPSN